MSRDYSRVATLGALIREGEGGHASIDLPPAARGEVAEAYRGRIAEFEKRPFWTVGEADYRPERGIDQLNGGEAFSYAIRHLRRVRLCYASIGCVPAQEGRGAPCPAPFLEGRRRPEQSEHTSRASRSAPTKFRG